MCYRYGYVRALVFGIGRSRPLSRCGEVASYLSGGIDSCAVLGLAQQEMDRPIRAFTLTFENPLYDEANIAEAQARHVGATYHPIPITGREIADSFADAIWLPKRRCSTDTASPSTSSAEP